MVALIYPDPAAVKLLAEDEHLVKVPSTFAFGNQLQYELRSHYAPSAPLAEVDAQATSVASMAAVLSVDRGAWQALYAMVAPFLTPTAQDDINIVTGRASQPHWEFLCFAERTTFFFGFRHPKILIHDSM